MSDKPLPFTTMHRSQIKGILTFKSFSQQSMVITIDKLMAALSQ